MPSQSDPYDPANQQMFLLKAIELLVEELEILATEDWQRLPDLKKAKVVAASRLRGLQAEARLADGEPNASVALLVAALDEQSQRNIRVRLERISNQILALQELSLYLRECLSVTLGRAPNRPLGNGVSVV